MFRRNVLIFHTGGLGDFVLTWPLAMALGRLFPQSRIRYVTHASKGKLAEKLLGVESIDIESGWHELFSERARLLDGPRGILTSSHSIVSFVADAGDAWEHNIRRITPESTLLLLHPPPRANLGMHASQFILNQLLPWPAIHGATRQMIASVNDKGIGSRPPGQGILIHPGSGGERKCWPMDRFIELIQMLTEKGESVRAVLGEAEIERWTPDAIGRFGSLCPVIRPVDYLDLAVQIRASKLFICNDSGPGHLSGVLGVPTISLFGPTSPDEWKPLGPKVTIVHREALESLPVELVLSTALPIHHS